MTPTRPLPVHGEVAPGWGRVADAFAGNFTTHGDVGAAVAIYLEGRCVVDLWAGAADASTGRPWSRETVGNVFSCTKGWMATLVNQLIQDNALDPDAPVCRYWPAFAAAGKDAVTVNQVLSHQAGLAAISGDFTLDEALSWTPIVDAIAAAKPDWAPGARHGYHVRSFGWLTGELVRSVTGEFPDAAWRRRIADPLGLSAWVGMPLDQQHRCARLIPPDPVLEPVTGPDPELTARARSGPSGLFRYDEMWNRQELRSAVIPSSGGIADACSLAKLYAACVGEVDGVRLLDSDTAAAAAATLAHGVDYVLGTPSAFGRGYMVGSSLPADSGPGSFGHAGAGGSLSFADPRAGLGFGYLPNRMRLDTGDPRAQNLAAAAYQVLSR